MDHYQKGWKDFIALCLATQDAKLLSELFDLFLTFEEKQSLSMRTLIIKSLLAREKPQREIAKEFNVSIAKITRGSNELKRCSKKLLRFLEEKW
jgi:TrpR family trp operon transcriptional repressor